MRKSTQNANYVSLMLFGFCIKRWTGAYIAAEIVFSIEHIKLDGNVPVAYPLLRSTEGQGQCFHTIDAWLVTC